MSLDVDPPDPPELDVTRDVSEYDDVETTSEEYRREELESFLADGAWDRAFGEWAEHTDLDETAFAIAEDLGMFREFDFFWDSFASRVGYHAPGIPEDWKERQLHADLDSWGTASSINAELAQFGQVVSSVLKEEYVDWDEEYEAPDDLPDY